MNIVEQIKELLTKSETRTPAISAQRILVATCVLMLEMAHTDYEFSSVEEKRILDLLLEQYDLPSDAAKAILALAEAERERSLDLWQFTNLINTHYDYQEKIKVIESLWRVIYADGHVDKHEEYLIRRLSNLLNLKHKDLIQAKFNARDSYTKPEGDE